MGQGYPQKLFNLAKLQYVVTHVAITKFNVTLGNLHIFTSLVQNKSGLMTKLNTVMKTFAIAIVYVRMYYQISVVF